MTIQKIIKQLLRIQDYEEVSQDDYEALNDAIMILHDGWSCEGCKYMSNLPWQVPCRDCQRIKPDYFRKDE